MPLSDRTKRLLDWWTLRIQTNRNPEEERKENVERINPPPDINTSDSLGDNTHEREGVK